MALWRAALWWGCGGLLFTSPVFADAVYADDLKADLDLPKAPPCTVCHESGEASDAPGPADTLFESALFARGFRSDAQSLQEALVSMVDVDSDGDGARDLDELYWGGDPNRADTPSTPTSPPPAYGCQIDVGHRQERIRPTLVLWLGSLFLLAWARARAA